MPMHQTYRDELLDHHLRTYLGSVEPEALAEMRASLEWVEVHAGQTLMTQGEAGDAMYLVLSGRLRAYIDDGSGTARAVRDMGRGQIIGEMSLITGEPRLATVVAIRDSVLVRLADTQFQRLLATSAQLSVVLTRQIIQHLRAGLSPYGAARPVTIGLVPVSANVDAASLATKLAAHLARVGRVRVLDAAEVDADLREPGVARNDDAAAARRVAMHVDEVEAGHDFVLLVADATPTAWTGRCCMGADEVLLLADAAQPPALHPNETTFLVRGDGRNEADEILVLLHPADRRSPHGTRAWLARRPVDDHLHLRPDLDGDVARLARIESHTAVGLVFAGGGARGLAHLGVWRALRERGVAIDYVGGTSIGAIMAALVASDVPVEVAIDVARRSFSTNPTGDFNVLPLLSLIKGRRLRRVIHRAMKDLFGFEPDIEDLWKTYYCIASNYSQASEHLIRHGNLARAMRASIAIPGALPPVVHDGDLLCDGGTFNNFPVDVMRRMRGVGTVIGVDLNSRKPRRIEVDEVPGTLSLLRDRMRPYVKRRYRFPSLMAYLMNVQILYSMSRQTHARRQTDVYFNPPLERVGMLQWNRFDEIVGQGHAHGTEVLEALDPQAIARMRAEAA
ncbi:MAG: patatin-like phospholipase family protein [Burkholderiales bacterium]